MCVILISPETITSPWFITINKDPTIEATFKERLNVLISNANENQFDMLFND